MKDLLKQYQNFECPNCYSMFLMYQYPWYKRLFRWTKCPSCKKIKRMKKAEWDY